MIRRPLNCGGSFWIRIPWGCSRSSRKAERQCFWAWSAVTRSLCEIARDLAKAPREELRGLQKLFLAPKNSAEVRLGELEHLRRAEPAAVVFAPEDLFSRGEEGSTGRPAGELAVFNWSEKQEPSMSP